MNISTMKLGWCLGLILWGPAMASEWSSWRGPGQNGYAPEKAVVTSWTPGGEGMVWKVPIEGRSTPVILNHRLYAIAPVGDVNTKVSLRERVICLDLLNGRKVWEHRFNVFDTDIVQQRVGWTSLVGDPETGNIYAHGTGGELLCFDKDGKVLWKRSLTEEFGRVSGYGGRLMTPIIDENRLIISFLSSNWGNHAAPRHRYVAFDKKTGEVLWWAAPGEKPVDTTYSIPVVTVIDGKRMLIAPNGDGNVYGMSARTGEKLWTFKLSTRGLNASPVVLGNYAYVTHSEENIDTTEMGRVVCIDAGKTGDITQSGEVWRASEITAGYASPALANGRLYVVDNSAVLHALDAKTGKSYWTHSIGRVGKGSPTVTSDGVIYVGEQNGVFHILKDEGDKVIELDRDEFEGPDHMVDEIYGSPAVVDGRVYFMTRYNTYCLGKRRAEVERATLDSEPREAAPSGKLAVIHPIPGEVTLNPGQTMNFRLELIDSVSQPFANATDKPEWSVSGVNGTIDDSGKLTVDGGNVFSAGLVTARIGEVTGTARVRVSPTLPFTANFDEMKLDDVPPGWVGVASKTKLVERDGSHVLQKLAVNPSAPFMRMRSYMMPSIEGGYTVIADMLGTPKGTRFSPEMGVINTRYFLELLGGEQVLRVESWSPLPRFRQDFPFNWKTNVWYRMKCRVEVGDDKTRILGKVWPRDEKEPEGWTINVVDPYPNTEGSPGLYAYSPGTTSKSKGPEVFFDNIQVMHND